MKRNGLKKQIWFTYLLMAVSVASLLSAPFVSGSGITSTTTLTITSTFTHSSGTKTSFSYTTRTITSTFRTSTSSLTSSTTSTIHITTITSLHYIGQGIIGYIGCSNTQFAVIGYHSVVTSPVKKLFWDPYDTIGGTLDKWANNETNRDTGLTYWAEYSQQIEIYGQPQKVWIQICEDASHPLTFNDVTTVIRILRQFSPHATFFISPLNTYSPVGLCSITGPNGVQDATKLANEAVSAGLAMQGPILGPLTAQNTYSDHCHPNPTGQTLLGSQLNAFFSTH